MQDQYTARGEAAGLIRAAAMALASARNVASGCPLLLSREDADRLEALAEVVSTVAANVMDGRDLITKPDGASDGNHAIRRMMVRESPA